MQTKETKDNTAICTWTNKKEKRKYIGNNIIKFGSFKTFTNKVQKLFRLSVEESLKQNENKPQLTNRKQVSFS